MNDGGRGDLWLVLALVGVVLLLVFCAWGVHFTPDMSQSPDTITRVLGTTTLCGGLFLLLFAGLCIVIKI